MDNLHIENNFNLIKNIYIYIYGDNKKSKLRFYILAVSLTNCSFFSVPVFLIIGLKPIQKQK